MPLGGKFLGSLRTLGVRLGTSALGGRGLGFVNNAVNTLLHLFNSDGSDDTPAVTYPPAATEHYVTVNNGGANELLYKAPAGAVLRVGERPTVNMLQTNDLTNALWAKRNGALNVGTNQINFVNANSDIRYAWTSQNPRGVFIVAVDIYGAVSDLDLELVDNGNGTHSHIQLINVTVAKKTFYVKFDASTSTTFSGKLGLYFNRTSNLIPQPNGVILTIENIRVVDVTMFADHSPPDKCDPATIDPRSNIAGMTWSIYENGNTVDANGVVTESQGTLIPASQRKGVLLEGLGGNAFGAASLIDDVWAKTNVLPLYESTEIAPDGSKMQVVEAIAAGFTRIFSNHNNIQSVVGLNTISVVVKYENLPEIRLYDDSTGFNGTLGKFNLLTKTFAGMHASVDAYGYEDLPNGCTRVWFACNYTVVSGGTLQIALENAQAGSKVHVWQAQFEPQARPSSITNLSSRASTLTPSTNIGQLPDEGELVMTLTALYDFADYQALSTETGLNWFFFQNNINNRILYHNPDASVWYSWNGTNAALVVGITWSKDDVLEAHVRFQLSSGEWQVMVRNLTTGIDYIGAEGTNFTGWNASTEDLVVNNALPWIHQDVKLLSTFPDVFF